MKIAMVGSGYVGLVSGACFADFGHDVVCIDKDASKIEQLHQGVMPIYEPGLDALVESNVKAGRLSFTTDLAEGFGNSHCLLPVESPKAISKRATMRQRWHFSGGFIGEPIVLRESHALSQISWLNRRSVPREMQAATHLMP